MRFAIVLVFCFALSACEDAAPLEAIDQPSTSAPHPVAPAATVRPELPATLQGTAQTFLDFAQGDGAETPPFAPRVDLLLGNVHLRTLTGEETRRRASWAVCPPVGYYAARSCPFSAVEVFDQSYVGRVAFTPTTPFHACVTLDPLPSAYEALEFVTLTPDKQLSCVDYFAVQLFVDGGLITAVNLVWAEP